MTDALKRFRSARASFVNKYNRPPNVCRLHPVDFHELLYDAGISCSNKPGDATLDGMCLLETLTSRGWLRNALDDWTCPECSKLAPPKPVETDRALSIFMHANAITCPNCDGDLVRVGDKLRCTSCHYAE